MNEDNVIGIVFCIMCIFAVVLFFVPGKQSTTCTDIYVKPLYFQIEHNRSRQISMYSLYNNDTVIVQSQFIISDSIIPVKMCIDSFLSLSNKKTIKIRYNL